jgi:predicted DNA-binding WGR domain protein
LSIRMSRVDSGLNMARFYEIAIQPGLFGDVSVTRHWGRIGAAGQSKSFWFDSETLATESAARIERSKRQRGYRDVHA